MLPSTDYNELMIRYLDQKNFGILLVGKLGPCAERHLVKGLEK